MQYRPIEFAKKETDLINAIIITWLCHVHVLNKQQKKTQLIGRNDNYYREKPAIKIIALISLMQWSLTNL